MQIVDLEIADPRWAAALPVLQQLRPHVDLASLQAVLAEGAAQGYRFTAAMDGDRCLGLAGWRIMATFHVGRKLYVDDLVTAEEARSTGVGAALVAELRGRAVAAGCSVLDLDSGVQRFEAHRFYLRERMHISSHHFTLPL
jgi:GNAT superfamily N-acetyltransferase